ncbi:MAG: WecB/TagA/CpsF family glycosyltransferase [Sphingobium sp.]
MIVDQISRIQAAEEISILGYRVHPLTGDEVIDQITAAVVEKRRLVMANINLHGMAVMFENGPMAKLLSQADAQVMIDGMPIIGIANLQGHKLSRTQRTTSLDFYDKMFALGVSRGWRFGYVGGTPDTLRRGLDVLRARIPGLDIDGYDGYFDISDDRPDSRQSEIINWLNERSHDILIVGMGMPRQEEWIERIQAKIPTRVLMPTGAYLDYQVGAQKLAPRWMGQLGIEWAYRLVSSPKRLGYRYLVEPAVLLTRLAFREHPQKRWRGDKA